MKQQTLISENSKKDFRIICQEVILFMLLVGLLTACAPGEPSANLQEETPTIEIVIEPTATLSDEEIREQRLSEIALVVEENENTFTIEELDAYLQKYGTGWESGVESMIKVYEGSHVPFKYYFIEDNYKDSGVVLSCVPYQFGPERTMYERNNFPCPKMVNERRVSKIISSIYDDLWIRPEEEYGAWESGWIKEPGKYTTVIYIQESTTNDGEPIDELYYDIGGYTFIDSDENVKYISLEKIFNHELTDEEMALFTDEVLSAIKEGWTTFVTNEDGSMEKRSNFKEFRELINSALVEEDITGE